MQKPVRFDDLAAVVIDYCQQTFNTKKEFEKYRIIAQRKHKVTYNNYELRMTYNYMRDNAKIQINPNFEQVCKIKNVREMQGVIVITVVMSPEPDGQQFSCQFDCSYCPNVPGYARSYYPDEPAVNRGRDNKWDPILQVHDRIQQYINNGIMHKDIENIDGYKVDFIIEGGTYTSYPEKYRTDFIHKLFYACNTFYVDKGRTMLTLKEEQTINENSMVRIIGLSVETRPDTINMYLIKELRILGVTRVQIGVQHLDDDILRLVNRRCYTRHTKRAIKYLLDNCFKVAVHYMPDLPGSSPDRDLDMWEELFNDPDLEFDYCKVYPCMTMPYTLIDTWYKEGKYKPYADEYIEINGKSISKVVPVCADFLRRCKKHHRVERMLRDLPVNKQEAGCGLTNLRQIAEELLAADDTKIWEIRHREVKNKNVDYSKATLFIEEYLASDGNEYFISIEDDKEVNIYGFIRLRLASLNRSCLTEIKDAALIREIHVYGIATPIGNKPIESAQHRGFGTKLLYKAEEIAKSHGYDKLAVIAGEGVKGFYRKRGFYDGEYYLLKNI